MINREEDIERLKKLKEEIKEKSENKDFFSAKIIKALLLIIYIIEKLECFFEKKSEDNIKNSLREIENPIKVELCLAVDIAIDMLINVKKLIMSGDYKKYKRL